MDTLTGLLPSVKRSLNLLNTKSGGPGSGSSSPLSAASSSVVQRSDQPLLQQRWPRRRADRIRGSQPSRSSSLVLARQSHRLPRQKTPTIFPTTPLPLCTSPRPRPSPRQRPPSLLRLHLLRHIHLQDTLPVLAVRRPRPPTTCHRTRRVLLQVERPSHRHPGLLSPQSQHQRAVARERVSSSFRPWENVQRHRGLHHPRLLTHRSLSQIPSKILGSHDHGIFR